MRRTNKRRKEELEKFYGKQNYTKWEKEIPIEYADIIYKCGCLLFTCPYCISIYSAKLSKKSNIRQGGKEMNKIKWSKIENSKKLEKPRIIGRTYEGKKIIKFKITRGQFGFRWVVTTEDKHIVYPLDGWETRKKALEDFLVNELGEFEKFET